MDAPTWSPDHVTFICLFTWLSRLFSGDRNETLFFVSIDLSTASIDSRRRLNRKLMPRGFFLLSFTRFFRVSGGRYRTLSGSFLGAATPRFSPSIHRLFFLPHVAPSTPPPPPLIFFESITVWQMDPSSSAVVGRQPITATRTYRQTR